MPVRTFAGLRSIVCVLLACALIGPTADAHAQNRGNAKSKRVVKLAPVAPDTTNVDALSTELPRTMPPLGTEGQQKNDWFYQRRAFPDQYIEPELFQQAREQARLMPVFSRGGKNSVQSTPQWQQIGPYSIGGRVTSLAMHPTNGDIFYVGAASGGVWKTTDKGKTFVSMTDTFSALPVGTLEIDPKSPETIYLGQGECNYSADSWPGNGLWRSENGGNTWQYLGLARTQYIAEIIIDPRSSDVIYVASPGPAALNDTNRGVYKSTDRGATWVNVLRPRVGNTRIPIIDLAMNPTNPDELVAAAWDRSGNAGIAGPSTGLWHTTDAGATWKRIDTLGLGYPDSRYYNFNRTALHWANTSNGPVLYAAISYNDTNILTKRNNNANFHGLYSSASPSASWTKLQDSTLRIHYGGLNFDSVDILHRQGYYNFYLEGNPHNGDEVYIGGIDVLRSTDGGKSFSNITHSYGGYYFKNNREQHPDQHHLAFGPAANDLFVASDGGVFHTTNFGTAWSQLGGLPITMFYSLTPWYGGMRHLGESVIADSLRIFGGTQDNGTVAKGLTASADYDMINNADGGVAWAHPTDPEKIFVSKQQGRILLRVGLDSLVPSLGYDGPATDPGVYQKQWHNITRILTVGPERLTDTTEPVGFIAPFVVDPIDPTNFYTGRMRLYKAKVNYESPELTKWSVWSPYLTGDSSDPTRWTGYTVEAIGIGPRDISGRAMLWQGGIFLTKSGSSALSIHRTPVDLDLHEDSAPRWISARGTGLPLAIPTAIVPDPVDSMTAFISFSRYSNKNLYKTTNGGKNWVSISGNLPFAPVNAFLFDREAEGGDITKRNQYIFAATDVGVFMTRNGGSSWMQVGAGMPTVVVGDIKIYKNQLIAGTHGNSAFAIDLNEVRTQSKVERDREIKSVSAYPNPLSRSASSTLTFELDHAVSEIRLINLATGTDVTFDVSRVGDVYELSVPSEIPSGNYLLHVVASTGELYQAKVAIF